MSPEAFHRPIIPLLLSLIIGILIGAWAPGKTFWVFGLVLSAGGFLFRAIQKNSPCLTAPLLTFVSLGYLLIQPSISPRLSSNHIVHFHQIPGMETEGIIERIDFTKIKRIRFLLKAESIRREGRTVRTDGRIRVTAFGKSAGLAPGDRIAFSAKIRPFRNFNNPGGFDYKRYMTFKKIWGAAYIPSERIVILEKASTGGIRQRVENGRLVISRFLERQAPDPAAGVLKALLVGNRTGIPAKIKTVFYRTGTGHILAISGLHIGIIAAVSFFIFRWLLSYVTPMLWGAWCGKGAALLSLIPVWSYGMIAGMSPSTLRAVIMVSIFLTALLLERDQESVNTLAVAALFIVVIDPTALFSISFQLSFASVLSILLGYHRIAAWNQKKGNGRFDRLRKRLTTFVLVSFLAIVGTLPLVMRYFNDVSLVGLLGNLIAIPCIGFMVVPLGLLSVFVFPFSLTLAAICIKTASMVLIPVVHLMSMLSAIPFAAVKTITPSMIEITCYYAILFTLCCFPKAPDRLRKPAAGIVIVFMAILFVDTGYWVHQRFFHPDLRITAIDVGQGSATLLECPQGKIMLVDGGGFSDNTIFDMGARVIAPILWRKKIMRIDTLILTHPNSDHLNGLLYVADHFKIGRIWSNGESAATKGYADFLRIIKNRNIPVPDYRQIPRFQNRHDIHVSLLYPPADFLSRKKTERWRVVNNNSLVLKIRYGAISFLFPGDIMERAEADLVDRNGERLKSTVLFSPHHGSRYSSTPDFLEKVSPEIVVISSGWRNRTGSPHASVLKRYRERGCRTYNTAVQGAITMKTDGRALQVTPFIDDSR